jgi:hypothetical protein
MSEPGVDPSSGKSSGDGMRLPERRPACRRREARLGFHMERENLNGDVKGKGTSGFNREAESTDAPARGGLLRSSGEAGVMPVERRGQVTDVGSEPTGNRRSSNSQRKAVSLRAVARAGLDHLDDLHAAATEIVRSLNDRKIGLTAASLTNGCFGSIASQSAEPPVHALPECPES